MAKKQKGSRKVGREKAKRKRSGSAISQYVRGKITFEQYVKMGGLNTSKRKQSPQ
jgi:hypothetical protein